MSNKTCQVISAISRHCDKTQDLFSSKGFCVFTHGFGDVKPVSSDLQMKGTGRDFPLFFLNEGFNPGGDWLECWDLESNFIFFCSFST